MPVSKSCVIQGCQSEIVYKSVSVTRNQGSGAPEVIVLIGCLLYLYLGTMVVLHIVSFQVTIVFHRVQVLINNKKLVKRNQSDGG